MTTPYYTDDYCTIYHGDCREIIGGLAADLVVTDPPYNVVNRDSEGLRNLDRGAADSEPIDAQYVAEAVALAVTGSAYVWCGSEQLSTLRATFINRGMSTRTGVWQKTNPSPMNGERMWLSAVELCVFARHPKATFHPHCKAPVWLGPTQPREDHPTAKPIWLFATLVDASSDYGDTVLDPFMGSGTTLRAAKTLGRKAVGIELEERYCEIAAKRLAQEVLDFGGAA